MKKIRVTPELTEQAKKVFNGKAAIHAGEGLNRQELRALERKGFVRKVPTYVRSPFVGGGSTIKYIWKLNEEFK